MRQKIHWSPQPGKLACRRKIGSASTYRGTLSAREFVAKHEESPDMYCAGCAVVAAEWLGASMLDLNHSPKHYCVNCSNAAHEEVTPKLRPITDSDRYAELRKLVEAWQEAHRQHDQARTTAPETEGWLKHWLNFCDAQKPLLDWRHR